MGTISLPESGQGCRRLRRRTGETAPTACWQTRRRKGTDHHVLISDAGLIRYEVAIRPGFRLGFGPPDFEEFSAPLEIVNADRTFVWHPIPWTEHFGEMSGPVLTVMWPDDDSDAAGLACNRFLSALSYALDQPIGIGTGADVGVGFKQPLDPPMMYQAAVRPALIVSPISELHVANDARLYQVLGPYREGLAAESPYLMFLSLHNALVAAFDGSENDAEAFATSVQSRVHGLPSDVDQFGSYFRDVLRNAIAHTIRREGKPTLDPNDPVHRTRAAIACPPVQRVVRARIAERWREGEPRSRPLRRR